MFTEKSSGAFSNPERADLPGSNQLIVAADDKEKAEAVLGTLQLEIVATVHSQGEVLDAKNNTKRPGEVLLTLTNRVSGSPITEQETSRAMDLLQRHRVIVRSAHPPDSIE